MHMLVIIHSDSGVEEVIVNSDEFSIGRSQKSDVTIQSDSLSRIHLLVKLHNEEIQVRDNGTTNGSFMDQRRLLVDEWSHLEAGAIVNIGNKSLKVEIQIVEDIDTDMTKVIKLEGLQDTSTVGVDESIIHNSESYGSSALKVDQVEEPFTIQTDREEQAFSAEVVREVDDVLKLVQESEPIEIPKLMALEIKKREIESQVFSLKIQEEAEARANVIIENATTKAKDIEKHSMEMENDKIEQINQLDEQVLGLNKKIYEIEKDRIDHLASNEQLLKTIEEAQSDIIGKETKLEALEEEFSEVKRNLSDERDTHLEKNQLIVKELSNEREIHLVENEKIKNELLKEREVHLELNESIRKDLLKDREAHLEDNNKIKRELSKEREAHLEKNNIIKNELSKEREVHLEKNKKISNDLSRERELHAEKIENIKNELLTEREAHLKQMDQNRKLEFESYEVKEKDALFNLEQLNKKIIDINGRKEALNNDVSAINDNKEALNTEIKDIKDRENKAHSSYERLEIRLDKLISEKEEAVKNLEEIESKVNAQEGLLISQRDELFNVERETEKEKNQFTQMQSELSNQFDHQKKILKSQIEEERRSILEEKTRLKEDLLKTASDMIEKAKESSAEIEQSASEKLEEARIRESKTKNEQSRIFSELSEEKKRHEIELLEKMKTVEDKMSKLVKDTKEDVDLKISDIERRQMDLFDKTKAELQNSQQRSAQIISEAELRSVELYEDGKNRLELEREGYIEKFNEKKQEIINLESILSDLASENDRIKKDTDAERNRVLSSVAVERERILNEANAKSESIFHEVNQEINERRDEANREHEAKMNELSKEHAIEIENISSEAINARSEAKRVHAGQVEKEKEYLAKLRIRELSEIDSMKKAEELAMTKRRNEKVAEISKGVEFLVNSKLKEVSQMKLTNSLIKVTSSDIKELVECSLSSKDPKDSKLLKKMNPYGSLGKGKSVKFMKKVLITFSLLATIFFVDMLFPKMFPGIYSRVSKMLSIDETAQDMYIDQLKETRAARPVFEPVLSETFKMNFVMNSLYTSNFNELWLSDEFQKKWTIEVDNLVVSTLNLSEETVVKYISEEFKLVRDLSQMREKVKFETQQEQIKEMNRFESARVKNLILIIKGKSNFIKIKKLRKTVYKSFLKSQL